VAAEVEAAVPSTLAAPAEEAVLAFRPAAAAAAAAAAVVVRRVAAVVLRVVAAVPRAVAAAADVGGNCRIASPANA
jgi:hypothetical protein